MTKNYVHPERCRLPYYCLAWDNYITDEIKDKPCKECRHYNPATKSGDMKAYKKTRHNKHKHGRAGAKR